MAKYKEYDFSQSKFIPINFDKQILPGTFEHTLHYILDNDLDLSAFDLRYQNDETGAPAYDPRMLEERAFRKVTFSTDSLAGCLLRGLIRGDINGNHQPWQYSFK